MSHILFGSSFIDKRKRICREKWRGDSRAVLWMYGTIAPHIMFALAINAPGGNRLSLQQILLADDCVVWLQTKNTFNKIITSPSTMSLTLAFA